MILIYRFLTTFFYPLLIFFIYCRKIIGKEDKTRFVEKIFSYSFFFERDKNKKLIWFHAASIGEAKSIFSLVQKLKEENSELEFLITTITLSSGNLVKKKFEVYKNIHHRYLPIDVNFLVKKFLNVWKPNLIIFVDSEIWPNLIFEINKRKIPSAIINGRITEKSFKKWMRVPSFAKQIFGTFNLSLASSKKSKEYLEKLGAKNLKYIGNLKLSETIDENENKVESKEKKRKKI